jgi:hypothetical protein
MKSPRIAAEKFDPPWKKVDQWRIGAASRKDREKASEQHRQALDAKRQQLNYDPDAPRCQNCAGFRKAGTLLVNSLPRQVQDRCKRHGFKVNPMGCCDAWKGLDGSEFSAEP